MDYFNVLIEHVDGTEEQIKSASREVVKDGVLHLFQRHNSYGPEEKHCGSWPLTSIKKWTRQER